MARFALLLGAALMLAACDMAELASDVNPDRVWARYELVYDGHRDRTEARASFRFGNALGTQLRLDADASVAFDGQPLALQTPLNITYYNAFFAGLRSEGTFRFTNTDGKTYRNTIRLRPIALPAALEPVRAGQAYTVTWEGEPVRSGEEVRLVLYRANLDAHLAAGTTIRAGDTSVTIPASQTDPILPGEITVRLTRTSRVSLTEATGAGGEALAEFNAPQRLVQVTG